MKVRCNRNEGMPWGGSVAALLAVLVALCACGNATADESRRERRLCKACYHVADLAQQAGVHEATQEYLTGLAKAETYTDREERNEVRADARQEYSESRRLVSAQHRARVSLCRDLGECRYDPVINPGDFLSPGEIAASPNPFWPLLPGTLCRYRGETEEGTETTDVVVTEETREILGVECVVVRDTVFLEGVPIEDTWDWYTQDRNGNVWYFGELSIEYEDGEVSGLEGSWEAGVDGAKPGIVMMANPQVGSVYRQEFLLGEAEDAAEVLSRSATAAVEYGTFNNCLLTGEFMPIDPEVYENKYYASGVGVVLEVNPDTGERTELVDVIPLP